MARATAPIKVLHVGLGPIGTGIVRQVAARKGMKVVGAVDIDPAKIGRDLGDVAALDRPLKVKVSGDLRKAIKSARPDVVVLSTHGRTGTEFRGAEAFQARRVSLRLGAGRYTGLGRNKSSLVVGVPGTSAASAEANAFVHQAFAKLGEGRAARV